MIRILLSSGSNGLNENQIQTILLKITKNSYFMSSKKVREFEILNTEYSFANIYKLKTYDQKRKLNECFVQYKAGRLEGKYESFLLCFVYLAILNQMICVLFFKKR